MEKTRSTHYSVPKKALSFFLAFLMVLTAVAVGIVPIKEIAPTAEAAITSQTAGKYYVRITWEVTNEGYSTPNSYTGYGTGFSGAALQFTFRSGILLDL